MIQSGNPINFPATCRKKIGVTAPPWQSTNFICQATPMGRDTATAATKGGGMRVNAGTGDIPTNGSRRRLQPLRNAAAKLDEAPALRLICLTGPAVWFWSVTRESTKMTCARRGRGKGTPRVTRPHDHGEFGRSWTRRSAA